MINSDETLKKPLESEAILKAIAELAQTVVELSTKIDDLSAKTDNLSDRLNNLEHFVTVQFDAVQEGIAYNSARFDRMEAKFFDVRSDVSNMRADVKELNQAVRKKEKELV